MIDARSNPLNNIFPFLSMAGFALAWYVGGIYAATMVLMGLMTLHIVLLALLYRRVHKSALAMWLLVLVLGALTLLFREKAFIQLKTTVVYGVMALALVIADVLGKNLPKMLLAAFFDAPDGVWRRVSTTAALYFLALAACNYWVATYLSESAWVIIKTFVFPGVTVVFTILALLYLYRYARPEQSDNVDCP